MKTNTEIINSWSIEEFESALYQLYPSILRVLLKDHTTGKNIVWATSSHFEFGAEFGPDKPLNPTSIIFGKRHFLKTRATKSQAAQAERTKNKAEVFTPSWVCNLQNNLVDDAWLENENSFNVGNSNGWETSLKPIQFPIGKTWKDYVSDIRLEIACGEAPYLVSRYDTVTGKSIEINNRIGLLDRKFRVINENVKTNQSWNVWVIKAYESIYGYEFQGDNLFLARENLLFTYIEYFFDRFKKFPSQKQLSRIAEIISWNIWQMDGLTNCLPFSKPDKSFEQLTLGFDDEENVGFDEDALFDSGDSPYCLIADWTKKIDGHPEIIEFHSLLNR
ncbi:restriction endonuclease subunit M [uncultured Dubosiella sp.]|uniref:restriction endonuclease subunit M n=1 Tax=uncultured Dubosiella sp. TaxID=1937011 RepID=UPI002629EBC1|nr:restriction endonuclease subunit M [uncultured Dubosiella sp.]